MTEPTRVVDWHLSVEPYWCRVPGSRPLLEAVALAPDDLLAHRALADVCEEAGEADRASLIRLQLGREDANWRDFSGPADERRLIDAHAGAWLAGLPSLPGLDWRACFYRGLVCRARLKYSDLAKSAPAMFRAADIRHLRVEDTGDEGPREPIAGADLAGSPDAPGRRQRRGRGVCRHARRIDPGGEPA